MKAWLCLCAAFGLATTPALADDPNFKFGARAGTLGFGPEIGVQLHKRINVRASFTGAEINAVETIDGIEYDANLRLGASGAQIDIFPMFGGVYVTLGGYANDNAIELTAVPVDDVQVGDTVYTAGQVGELLGDVAFDQFAGYAGLGWTGRLPMTAVETFIEAGAYFQGAPQVDYVATGLLSADPNFLADVTLEAEALEDELSILETYPSVNAGLRIRF